MTGFTLSICFDTFVSFFCLPTFTSDKFSCISNGKDLLRYLAATQENPYEKFLILVCIHHTGQLYIRRTTL